MPLPEKIALEMLKEKNCPFTVADYERSKKDTSIPLCTYYGLDVYLSVMLPTYAR